MVLKKTTYRRADDVVGLKRIIERRAVVLCFSIEME